MSTKDRDRKRTVIMTVLFKLLDSQPKLDQWLLLSPYESEIKICENRKALIVLRMRNINDVMQ